MNLDPVSALDLPASSAEDLFVEIFQEAIGFVGAQWLQFQVPFTDIDQRQRRLDYALNSP